MAAFSIIMAKISIKPTDLKALNYALWELCIKVNDSNVNIKYARNNCVSLSIEIGKNQK